MRHDSRIYTLDAMRGAAAIMVVMYHLSDIAFSVAPGGYLAVDFFFALSGFVLARVYEGRLKKGLSPYGFMKQRIIRLYPLFMIGVVFAVIKAIGQIATGDLNAPTPNAVALTLALEAFMLPSPFIGDDLFPLNGPAWSLFFELVINFVFAMMLVRMKSVWLFALCLISGTALALASVQLTGLNVGWGWSTSWAGLARVTFSFSAGVMISRHHIAPKSTLAGFTLPIAALVLIMILPVSAAFRPLFDAASILILSPLLLVAGIAFQPPRIFIKVSGLLGDISYPLYAVHFPLLFMAGFAARRMELPPSMWVGPFMAWLIFFAWFLGRFIDPLARSMLSSILIKRD